MGDDNEIRQLIRHESESFLKTALVQSKDEVQTYNLDAEFAKTKANKSFIVIGATLATIVVLAVAAFLVTRAIERSIAAAPVDVTAFEDLNLKDILDTSKRNEADMTRAKLELSQMDSDLKAATDAVDRDTQSTIESIQARAPADAKDRIAAANAAADAKKRKLKSDYNAAAAPKRQEIAAIQKRIDQYDTRMIDQANKQQAVLQSERQAFDIEKKQQADFYESRIAELQAARQREVEDLKRQKTELAASLTSRYNPTFSDDRSVALLTNAASSSAKPGTFHPYLGTAGVLDSGAMARLDKSFSDFEYLASKLRAVPYLNSVPPSLTRIESEARSSIASYRSALASAGSGLQDRDDKIAALTARAVAAEASLDQFKWAVASFARESRDSGYVIDSRNADRVLIYLDSTVPVAEGATGYAVRGDKTIANLIFHINAGKTTASVSSLEPDETLLAFDSIVVDAKGDAPIEAKSEAQ